MPTLGKTVPIYTHRFQLFGIISIYKNQLVYNMANPIIDLEKEDLRQDYIKDLFEKNHIYIPEEYYLQLKQMNLLDYLVQMIEQDDQMESLISNLLKQHNVFIPSRYYQPMINKKIFWPIIRALGLVDVKKQLDLLENLPIDHSDDEKESSTVRKKRKASDK